LDNLRFNVHLDGLFHAATYLFVLIGLVLLWRAAHRTHVRWSGKLLAGTLLMGFGLFNVVEALVNHHLLGLHHVNETVPQEQWIYWDVGFLLWGAAMLLGGWEALVTPVLVGRNVACQRRPGAEAQMRDRDVKGPLHLGPRSSWHMMPPGSPA
jgi:uncharacterized membrane protein